MKSVRNRLFCGLLLILCACVPRVRADEVLVSAAASLTDAFKEIGKAYTTFHPKDRVRFNFGASGALLRQIEQGAPVDVFASASPKEMDALQRHGGLRPGTRLDFAGNQLVLIVRPGSRVNKWDDLRQEEVRRVAISDPASVPSGRYAQETLTRRGLWKDVRPKAVLGENVRQTLVYVATGDADAGIVFVTDARIERRVRVVRTADDRDHSPIVYPAAATSRAPHPEAAERFVQFLHGPTAQRILASYGFTTPASIRRALQPVKKPRP